MEMIIEAIMITIFISLCLLIISKGINKQLEKELERQKKLNQQMLALYQNEKSRTDTLLKILHHIKEQLSLLKLKDCPEEEFKNIPFEMVEWIDLLEKINNGEEK